MEDTYRIDKVKNLWRYPRGTSFVVNDTQYWFIDKNEIGTMLFDGYTIVYLEDLFEEEEYGEADESDILVFKLIQKDVKMLIKGIRANILILLEEYNMHKETIKSELNRLTIATVVYNVLGDNKI